MTGLYSKHQNTPIVASARGRVACAFSCITLGLVIGREVNAAMPALWFSFACGALAVAGACRGRACAVALGCAAVLLGAGWIDLRINARNADPVVAFLDTHGRTDAASARGVLLTIEGIVLEDPAETHRTRDVMSRFRREQRSHRFTINANRVETSEGVIHSGTRFHVFVNGAVKPDVRAGDRVRLTGLARGVERPANPGETDVRMFARQARFAGTITLTSPELIIGIKHGTSIAEQMQRSFLRFRASARARAAAAVESAIPRDADPDPAAIARALLLGDPEVNDLEVRQIFTRLGLAHALTVSGFHLSVMAIASLTLLRLTGDRGWIEPVLLAVLVVVYSLIVPPASPLLRSAAMVLLWLISESFGRRYDRLTVLIWIAIALLIWRPADLWSLGYQLSFGLTATLFWVSSRFHERIFGPKVQPDQPLPGPALATKLLEYCKLSFSSGALCCIVAVPVLMFRVGIISPLATVATMLITPLIVAALWIGYAALALGFIHPPLAAFVGAPLRLLLQKSIRAAELLESVPLSWTCPPPVSVAWTFAATGAVLLWARFGRFRDSRTWIGLAVLLLWLGLEWRRPFTPRPVLRIDTISVGHGTCHLIRSGSDSVLWDCGSLSRSDSAYGIFRAIRSLGAWRTPTVIVSHPDLDHYGSLPDLIRPLAVRSVLVSPRYLDQAVSEPDGPVAHAISVMKSRGVVFQTMQAGDECVFGLTRCAILSPPIHADWPSDNDHSLVARFEVSTSRGIRTLVLTGDVGEDAISAIRVASPTLHADILELPHHGSPRPAAVEWTISLSPRVILQSTGPSRLDDPRWDSARMGRDWYVTCRDGASWAEVHPDGTIRSGAFRAPSRMR